MTPRVEIVTTLGTFATRGTFRIGELVYILGVGFCEVRSARRAR